MTCREMADILSIFSLPPSKGSFTDDFMLGDMNFSKSIRLPVASENGNLEKRDVLVWSSLEKSQVNYAKRKYLGLIIMCFFCDTLFCWAVVVPQLK